MISRRALTLALAASCLATRPALADKYPTRPIKMIVPLAPGSPVDVVGRLLAQNLSADLKQSVVVENRPGAGTTIGMKAVATSEPDGYTLMYQSSSLVVAPAMYKNLDYDPVKAFAPVANVAWGSWVTVVPPELPVKNAQELIAYAKAHPNKLNFGYGQGTAPQLVGEWFNKTNGLAIASVPYKGGMQAVTDMMGGTIQLNIGTTSTLLPLIREGKIRAIAQWGTKREADLPDVPTMIESGVPDMVAVSWTGLVAPPKTPAAIIARLNQEVNAALKSEDMIAALGKLGSSPLGGSPQDFRKLLMEEGPKWLAVVKSSGMKIE